MKYSVIILFFVFVVVIIYVNLLKKKIPHERYQKDRFKTTNPKIAIKLYWMMDTIHNLLNKNGIKYVVAFGTLLGALRSKGMIKWDDDLDIYCGIEDYSRIEALTAKLRKLGLIMIKADYGFKIYPIDGHDIPNVDWKYPALDIFVMKPGTSESLEYLDDHFQKTFGKCIVPPSIFDDIQQCQFGNNYVNCPSKEMRVEMMKKCYGGDCFTHGYERYDHSQEKGIESVKVVLTDEEKEPAQPFY